MTFSIIIEIAAFTIGPLRPFIHVWFAIFMYYVMNQSNAITYKTFYKSTHMEMINLSMAMFGAIFLSYLGLFKYV